MGHRAGRPEPGWHKHGRNSLAESKASFQLHTMADTSLSSVVSGLVRAQMGTSVSSKVSDEDLDRHVAELILKEAKKKAEQYGKQGISAYLPQSVHSPLFLLLVLTPFVKQYRPESNVPKPNKRFLSSIIRNTDDHNKSILRSQALSAAEIRMEREAQVRADRRARAQEAVAAERARRSVRGRDDSWDRERRRRERSWERHESDEGEDRRPKRRRRDDDEDGVEHERSHGSRSARRSRRDEEGSSRRRKHRSRSLSDDEEEREKSRRRLRRTSISRSRSPDDKPSSRGTTSKRHRSHSPDDEGHPDHRTRDKRRSHRHDSSRRHRHRHRSRSPSRTPDKASRSETLSEGLSVGNRPSGSRASSQPPVTEDLARRESELRRKLKGKGKASTEESARPHSRTSVLDTSMASRDVSPKPPRSPSPGPRPPPGPPPPLPPPADFSPGIVRPDLPSKMDKYFEASYDPRLDVAPLAAPSIPSTGLLNNAEFEGWDAMLELIKQKRADKAERKRLERLGLVEKSGGKEKKKGKSKVAELGVAGTLAGWSEGGDGLMDIEYKKRGSVREWDLGKESPT